MSPSDPDEHAWRSRHIEAAAREIERHLTRCPNASDTLHGVRDWWLAALGEPLGLDVVQVALDRLVERGVLEERPVPGGGVVYARVRPERG